MYCSKNFNNPLSADVAEHLSWIKETVCSASLYRQFNEQLVAILKWILGLNAVMVTFKNATFQFL